MTGPEVVTFGCRLNAYESEAMREQARAAGLGNAIIVNTCAVTAEAERQARQSIRRLRRERPEARIVVTGCAAQVKPEDWAGMAEVDHVIGNAVKLRPETWAQLPGSARVQVTDIMTARDVASHLVEGFEGKARAILQVQNGCDHRCTFCIIPYGRGNSRSVPLGEVVNQAHALVASGYAELVLSGVDLTSWGHDLPGRPTLGQGVRRLLALVPELKRLRLSSLDPVEIDDDLFRLIVAEPRVMPHVHLSLQSGDDMILKRMKRRHARADAIDLCNRIRVRRPDVVFGADLIAGFPTEDETMFTNTLALVAECGLTWLHIFPYSPRPGTPAARMPQVPAPVRKERATRLRRLALDTKAAWFAGRIGETASVLVERNARAHDDWFTPFELDRQLAPGTMARVHVTGASADRLIGRIAA